MIQAESLLSFTEDYNAFGVRVSTPMVNQLVGLDGLISNIASEPVQAGSIINGQINSEITSVNGFMQSGNFKTGVSGWRISGNGDCEFQNGIFRGDISASTITGGTFQTATSGQRIRIISTVGSTPTQDANSLMLINSSGHGVLSFGSSLGSSAAIMNITPIDTDQQGLAINNAVAQTKTLLFVGVSNISSTSALTAEFDNDGSGTDVLVAATGTGKAMDIRKSGTAANAIEISQFTDAKVLNITKSGSGGGTVIAIQNSGTGGSLEILQNANTGSGTAAVISTTSTTSGAVSISHTGGAVAIDGIRVELNGPTGPVIRAINSTSVNSFPILALTQASATSTNFFKLVTAGGTGGASASIWLGNGNSPNGALTGVAGDFLIGGPSGHPFWCGGGTTWTQI